MNETISNAGSDQPNEKKNSDESSQPNQDLSDLEEEVQYFTVVSDLDWVDHKAPDFQGNQKLNYLRMQYMVRKMIKFSRR